MLKITVKLTTQYQAVAGAARKALSDGLLESAQAMVRDARSRAPVATGYMRDQTTAERIEELKVVAKADAPYSGFVDMGTSRMAARPWFTPAADLAAAELEKRLGRVVADALKRLG